MVGEGVADRCASGPLDPIWALTWGFGSAGSGACAVPAG